MTVQASERKYAEAVTQAAPTNERTKEKGRENAKRKGKENEAPETHRAPRKARAIVLHAAPTKCKPGQMRRLMRRTTNEGLRCRGYAGSHKNTEEPESWHPRYT